MVDRGGAVVVGGGDVLVVVVVVRGGDVVVDVVGGRLVVGGSEVVAASEVARLLAAGRASRAPWLSVVPHPTRSPITAVASAAESQRAPMSSSPPGPATTTQRTCSAVARRAAHDGRRVPDATGSRPEAGPRPGGCRCARSTAGGASPLTACPCAGTGFATSGRAGAAPGVRPTPCRRHRSARREAGRSRPGRGGPDDRPPR